MDEDILTILAENIRSWPVPLPRTARVSVDAEILTRAHTEIVNLRIALGRTELRYGNLLANNAIGAVQGERERCATAAEGWAIFAEGRFRANEMGSDEFRTCRAAALTIAWKIREL